MPALTQPELLSIWERGEGTRATSRALALLGDTDSASATWPIGRRDAALLDLRVALFGTTFSARTSCPACAEEIELTFEADEVRRQATTHDVLEVHVDDQHIDVRLPTTSDLAAIEDRDSVEAAREQLLARCLACDPSTLEPHVLAAIVDAMAEADPQADVALELTCPECAQTWREPFDVVTYLWSELASWARHLLEDVHVIACAYGWSERDILQMTPVRRNAYLEMLR